MPRACLVICLIAVLHIAQAFAPLPADGNSLRTPSHRSGCSRSARCQHQQQRSCTQPMRNPTHIRASPRDDEVAASEPGKYKQAMVNTALSVGAAVAFGAGIGVMEGSTKALEFFAGYVVEQSLSVDNIFVFLLLFEYFKVPLPYQDRVLKWGIIGAVVMRGAFIAVGKAALEQFEPVLLVFAGILLVSAFKLLTQGEEEADEDLADNQIVALSRKLLKATDEYDGDKFFTMVSCDALLAVKKLFRILLPPLTQYIKHTQVLTKALALHLSEQVDGVRRATPLLLVLVCIELSDIVFAVDSIPAVFGVTKDPFIVYTSNIFAIVNLRSLFTVLANAVDDLPYLRPAVAIVLGFVGAKLGAEYFGYDISTGLSLGVITGLLSGGVGLSLYEKRAAEQEAQ
jgi:TerC family integral membrane protein